MKPAAIAFLAVAALVAGCDKTPATGTAGIGTSTSSDEAATIQREKLQSVVRAEQKTVSVPAAQLIFSPADEDSKQAQRRLAKTGATALKRAGEGVDMGEVLKTATRPAIAWPVNPLDDPKGAKRWAAVIAASVDTADAAAAQLVQQMPTRISDAAQLESFTVEAWPKLDQAELTAVFDQAQKRPVTLDLTGGDVRFLSGGKLYTVGPTGGTSAAGGVVQFNAGSSTFGGKTYQIAVNETALQQIKRTSVQAMATTSGNSRAATVNVGVK